MAETAAISSDEPARTTVIKGLLKKTLPAAHYGYLSRVKTRLGERLAIWSFLARSRTSSAAERRQIVKCIKRVHSNVQCPHLQAEMLPIISSILALPDGGEGVIVEAGSFHGGSASKLSHACAMRRRKLVIFDSFEGIPENDEPHERNIYGGHAKFDKGDWAGSLDLVQGNIRKYGRMDVCEFAKGWFADTMPGFDRPIDIAYVDVDLASSTRTCLKYLFPRLLPGGRIYSQDGHLPLVIDVLRDERFWNVEVGVKKPRMDGLGSKKLVTIFKN
jgi:O-methyltransferase